MDMEGSFLKKLNICFLHNLETVFLETNANELRSHSHTKIGMQMFIPTLLNHHDFSPSTATHLGFHDARDARSQKNYRSPKCQGREPEQIFVSLFSSLTSSVLPSGLSVLVSGIEICPVTLSSLEQFHLYFTFCLPLLHRNSNNIIGQVHSKQINFF